MPYLKIQTTAVMDNSPAFLKKASRLVAKELNKPESYVMVSIEPSSALLFAGSDDPTAFVELRAIGLPGSRTAELSRVLCEFVQSELGISKERVFINFSDVPANLWGWNGDTF